MMSINYHNIGLREMLILHPQRCKHCRLMFYASSAILHNFHHLLEGFWDSDVLP